MLVWLSVYVNKTIQTPSHHFTIAFDYERLSVRLLTAEGGFFAAHYLGLGLLSAQGVAITAATVSPISGIPIAIVLGLAGNNAFGLNTPDTAPGLTIATKGVLQAGICCVGAKLLLLDLAVTGLVGIPAVAASVVVGMTLIPMETPLKRQTRLTH